MAIFDWNNAKGDAQADVVRALDRLAGGDLSGTFRSSPGLAARVAPAVNKLQEQLVRQRAETTALATALADMRRAHEAGAIDATINADALAEPYRSVAVDINALAKSHIDVKLQVVSVVSRYADGDFSGSMERLPGKRAEITEAMDRAKHSFQLVSEHAAESDKFIAALAKMTEQHHLGWIDEQIPLTDFAAGGYRHAAELVNALVRSHIDVKMKIVDIITKYAHGDFSVAMDRLPGKRAQITEALDQVRALLPKPEDITAMNRVSAALDIVTANVMIADANNVICYMNRAVTALMRNAERDLQRDLPNFRADALISAKIDQFHKNPGHQTRLLADLRQTHTVEIVVGGRTMGLIANPLLDAAGNRIGAVVEWADRTLEVALEHETTSVVDSASKGDFTKRLGTEGRAGFIKALAENINRLVQTCDVALNDVVRVLGALAKGDLTEKITNDYEGTFGRLKGDSNATVDSLTRTVIDIREAADVVSASAREISAGNGDLSQRTEEQSASLEETSASMEQLTATVHQNADNAKQANEFAIGASAIAVKGGRVVGEVGEAMNAINGSAKKIVDIISVIDGIAFQTNILALNAAVEAARAGEQGRGFAVVAGEVRTLAQRSAAAAKEIKSLIGDSVDKTTIGSKLVDDARATMAEIVASVKRVTDIMAEITTASVEQGSGIEQVNQAVVQMDTVTQQNAALVEQIAASAAMLEERAQSLVGLVGVFTVANQSGGSFGKAVPATQLSRPKPTAVPRPAAVARHAAPVRPRGAAPAGKPAPKPAPKPTSSATASDEADWSAF